MVDWDYSRQYPNDGGESNIEAGIETKSEAEAVYQSQSTDDDHAVMEFVFHYDVDASGSLTASVYVSQLSPCLWNPWLWNPS